MTRTQVERVAAAVRDGILAGHPAPGTPLREVELAGRHQASRHTVRAALRQLAGEGLVRIDPHRGARVVQLDGAELRALFELRAALEVEAARLLQERHGFDPWPGPVEAAAAALQRACEHPDPDPVAIDAAHAGLHRAIVATADSPRITEAHAALTAQSRVVLVQSRPTLPPARMAALHRRLLQDLRSRGPETLRDHLREGLAAAVPLR